MQENSTEKEKDGSQVAFLGHSRKADETQVVAFSKRSDQNPRKHIVLIARKLGIIETIASPCMKNHKTMEVDQVDREALIDLGSD